jgi:hypothetical protein
MRADYTTTLSPGDDFQGNIMDSFMVQARETLGNMPHAMVRQGDWFTPSTGEDEIDEVPDEHGMVRGRKEQDAQGDVCAPRQLRQRH